MRARDGGCVGPRVGFPEPCGTGPEGTLEIDHVLSGGMGLRGPSEVGNLATLCRSHHRWKTEHANVGRRLLVAYLALPRM